MKVKSILLISGNSGKLNEFRSLLNIDTLEFENKSIEIPEIQSMHLEEIGEFKTNAALKLKHEIARFDAIMTDDTALWCDGLNGLPGPFIKWFLKQINVEGLYELLKARDLVSQAVCLLTVGLVKTGELIQFKGEVKGNIVAPRGTFGFGWDRIFQPQGQEITYGEMESDQKNLISHRALAVKKLRSWILGH